MKLSGNQIDDRIVEVHWDSELSHWRLMRFRDDKPNGNHRTVVENIIQSIVDGVEKDIVGFLHYSCYTSSNASHSSCLRDQHLSEMRGRPVMVNHNKHLP
jgi:hypothetical protein